MNQVINTFITGLNTIGQGFWDYAAGIFIQVSLLIILLLILDFMLRKRIRATLRYWIWILVFIKLILPPSLSLPTGIGYWCRDVLSAGPPVLEQASTVIQLEPAGVPALEDSTLNAEIQQIYPSQINPEPAASVPSAISDFQALTWQAVVFVIWLVGAAALSVLLIHRMFFVRRLIAQSEPSKRRFVEILDQCRLQLGIKRKTELRLSGKLQSPAVCGLFKPVILMPTGLFEKLSPEKLRAVLFHELVHIKRGDLLVNCVQTFLQIIYFYNPFVWLANAVVRRIREQAVDEMVLVALGNGAKGYSNTLIDIAEMSFFKTNLSLRLVGVVESKKALNRRIRHMLNRPIPKSAKLNIAGVLIVIVAGMALLPMAKAEKQTAETSQATSPKTLNEDQKLYMEWTEKQFAEYLDRSEYVDLSDLTKMELEKKWIAILQGQWSRKYYDAINCLAAIKSKKAVDSLLKIAADRRKKDNRDRWMATRALGMIRDESVVPELIHLVYHYNQNTRFWAQISLVRLTGKNFGRDWKKWAQWWNTHSDSQLSLEKKIQWISDSEWADPVKQQESDQKFIERLKQEKGAEPRRAKLRAMFNRRIARDRKTYTQRQLKEIENLYQVANKKWNTPEAKESLGKLVSKYNKANRVGCAMLYLGQMIDGQEREKYLKTAIEQYSDCWYGDGVQVGAYARFQLALYYQQIGKKKEASKLFNELREKFPDAIDHRGCLLSDSIPADR